MADAQADYSRLAEVVGGLGLHQHLCVIYETQEEQFAAALPYLRNGLDRDEKCLYFANENTAAAILDGLRKGGTGVDHYLRRGALTITHKRETDLQQGLFDPDWWTSFLNQAAAEARTAKFSGLRILGDMSWALRASNSTGKFIEYESRINHFVRGHDARVVCQYKRSCNPPELILGIIRTHPLVVYGGIVCKNPYYIPPEEFLKPNQTAQEVGRLLNNILTWERAQQALRQSDEHLRVVIDTVPALIHTGLPDGQLDFFNQRWLNYVGLSLEDLSGWKWTAVIHPEDVAAMVERWRAALATGEPYEHEARVRRADGEYRWMVHREFPLRDERGNIVKWYASSIDIEDRRRAEEAIRASEERWRAVFENSAVGIALTDPQGKFLSSNSAYQEMVGYTDEELRAMSYLDITYEEDREANRALAIEVWQGKRQQFQLEKRYRRKGGGLIWVRTTVSLGCTEGKSSFGMGIVEEITERKRAEEALHKGEERWRSVFENSAIGVALTDLNGQFLATNPVYQKMVGYNEGELRALSFLDITHEDYREANWTLIAELLEGKRQQFQVEKQYRRKDDSLIWVRNSVSLVPGTESMPRFIMALSEDITERKRAEESLRDSEERFRATFENAGVAMALVDMQGHPLKSNPALRQMLGFSEEELSRMAFTEFTHPDDRELDWGLYGELTAGKRDKYDIEKRYLKKDGSVVWGLLTVSLLKGRSGRPAYAVGMVQDITERKRAQEKLQRSRDQLRSLAARLQSVREEERTRVAREIHDELGQALTAIKIGLSSLSHELPAQKKQRPESIMKLVDETIQTVRRISTELRPAILDALGLVAAVEWAAEEFEARTRAQCRLNLPQEDIAIDQERATALFRIFQETLTNIARHANATEVNIRLAKENGNLSLEVRDNGKGVGDEQLSATSSLGVLGMRERALLLGGELTITGAPGKGTTVRVRIPEINPKPPEDRK